MRSSFKYDAREDKLDTQEFGGDETAHERAIVTRAEEEEKCQALDQIFIPF